MSKDNGGPAFGEFKRVGDVAMRDGGISIRDYFAATVQVSFQDALDVLTATGVDKPVGSQIVDMIAVMRWAIADAMLLERAK